MTSTEFDLPTFADLPLRPELLAAVAELGYTQPSPVQAEAIAPLVEGRDLLGQAATGTGKTAAFALPMLERLAEIRPDRRRATPRSAWCSPPPASWRCRCPRPSRATARACGARVVTVYGGAPVGPQWKALRGGVDVVVATPAGPSTS